MTQKKGRWRCYLCGKSKRGGMKDWSLHYMTYHFEPVRK